LDAIGLYCTVQTMVARNTNEYVLGIDLGGTTVSVAAVTPDRKIVETLEELLHAELGPRKGIQKITSMMKNIMDARGGSARAFGIGASGPVIPEKGIIDNPYTLPGWQKVSIIKVIEKELGIPGCLENDADMFALGEYWAGELIKPESLFALTFGTGVGASFIQHGTIFRGMGGIHPEAGHMVVDFRSQVPCYCGATGCLESLASGPAIGRQAQNMAKHCGGMMMDLAGGCVDKIDTRILATAARKGDTTAISVINNVATYMGIGILNAMQFFLPETVVVGGGVMHDFDLYEPEIRKIIEKANVMIPTLKVKLRKSKPGRKSAMLGAAYTALERLK